MSNTREGRITPLAWYTLWEYKLYFVNLGKWYAKIFLRKGKMTKTPYLTFEADSKTELLQKIDDHCLKTFGKIFRYKKLAHQEPAKKETKAENLKKETGCSYSCSYPDEVKKNAQEVTDGLLKFFVDIIVDTHKINRLLKACLVVSWLSLAWVIALIAFIL